MDRKGDQQLNRDIRSALVTGATGMLGASLARVLLREGIRVTALIRPGSRKRKNLPEPNELLTVRECALSDIGSCTDLPSVDAFCHFAWEGSYGASRNDTDLQDRNVAASLDAIRLAKSLGAKVFIGAGSQAEYGFQTCRLTPDTECRPETEYGKAKLTTFRKGSALAASLGLDFIWTRLLSVYGPFDNDYTLISAAIRALLTEGRFDATKGDQVWDYLYAEDAAEWFYRLALSGQSGQAYVLSGGEERSLRSYLTELRDTVAPEGKIRFGAVPYREHQVRYLAGDISKTVSDTEYAPKTAFRDGIGKTAEWIKKSSERGKK